MVEVLPDTGNEPETDFIVRFAPGERSLWLTIGEVSVYLKKNDDNLSVELHAKGNEDGQPLTEMYVDYGEIAEAQEAGERGREVV